MAAKSGARRKLALVIGIGKYEHRDKLQNPENDANDISSTLESIGFIVTKKLHLKCAEMKHVIIDFEQSIEPGDMVLFYFAGHGIQWQDQNYLIPSDIPSSNGTALRKSAINAQDILDTLSDCDPYVTIFLLDCCRNYQLRNLEADAQISHDGYIVKVCDFGLAQTRNETTRQTRFTQVLPCTLQWTAPEILLLEDYVDKSDIYSLGVVYWELASSKIPYDGHQDGVIRAFVLAGDRLKIPE
ncbi:unnamed protein product, partial [Rotaria sp. Silwood1]